MQCDVMRCDPLEVIFQHVASVVAPPRPLSASIHPRVSIERAGLHQQCCAIYFAPGGAEVPIRGAEPCGQKSGLGPEGVRGTMRHNGGGPGSDWRQSSDSGLGH